MPQPVSYNPGTPVSGSIQENSISYVVDGQNRNYRGGFGGLSWMSEVPAANNVIFIGNSVSLGRGPANIPLFYPSYNNSAANIVYAANTLPGSPRNFTTTGSAYNWAATNNFFINNSDNPIPRINTDGLALYVDASQPTSYPQTGTSWYDMSGFGNNGTLTNGPTFNLSGWFDFDGTDDWVQLSSLALSTIAYTKVAWFNPDGATNNIISGGGDGQHAFWMGGTATNLQAGHNGNWSTVNYSPGTMTGRWWFGAVSFNTSTGWKLYLNGQVVSTSTNTATFTGGTAVRIAAFDNAANLFNGKIATAQVYNRVLSDSEVKQNYFQSNIVQDGLVFMVDANNLVSYPKSGTTWYNLTGSIVSGSLINGPTFNPFNGGSIVFDGVDDYINYQNNINPTSSFSCEAWINFSNTSLGGSDTPILAKWSSASAPSKNFIFGYRNSGGQKGISFYLYNSSYTQQDNYRIDWDPTPNKWYHVMGVYSASNFVKIYVDGVEDFSRTSGVYSSLNPDSTQNLTSGFATGLTYFPGRIANAKIYNKALTSDEVQQNYQATKDKFLGENIVTNGLTLYLDSANKDSYPGTGTTWYDLSGNGYNGTLTNGPSFLSNQNGGILDFDGVDDYTSLGSSAASLIQGKTAVTIGIFFKLDVLDTLRGLIGTLNYFCGGNLGLVARGDVLTFYNDTGTCYDVGISSFVETGKWIYAVGTYDGTTTRIYGIKDGTLSQSSGTSKSGATNTFTSDFIVIGNQYSSYFTNGQCGTAFVYNRVLSQEEILQNYNATKTRFGL
jgi:hypothetical protein